MHIYFYCSKDIASGQESAFIALYPAHLQCCCNGGNALKILYLNKFLKSDKI